MGDATIGIKIADGTYFPILDADSTRRRRLILTTVKDGQTSVQINLYKGRDSDIAGAGYIGSIMIDQIEAAPKGEPEIELVIGIDAYGNLNAKAADLATDRSRSLNVSLESLADEAAYDIPDFDLDDSPSMDEQPDEMRESADDTDETGEDAAESRPRRHPFLLTSFIIVGLVIVALVVLLVFRVCELPGLPQFLSDGRSETREVAVDNPPVQEIAKPETVEVKEDETAEESAEPSEPVQPVVISEGGVWYWIRWGDTLWDISISFYRTPWLYGKIARENNIRNPDLIYAGTRIYIPKK